MICCQKLDDKILEEKDEKKEKTRIFSVDACRGLTIWFMILVNNAEAAWPILEHADWYLE